MSDTEQQQSSREAMNWIAGTWTDAVKRSDSFDPATSRKIGTYADADVQDAQKAIDAASRAFETSVWKEDRQLRSKVLNQLADAFERRREELVSILSLENGKVRREAEFEVDMIPSKLRFWAAAVLTEFGRALEVKPGRFSMVTRSAIGVVAVVAPFNSPLILTIRSLAPALAAGTTAVIKLPGDTAQTNWLFSQLLAETALPPGVCNVFSESGSAGSALLMSDPAIRVVSFTGSTKTAKTIAVAGANTLKIFQTELGGKTPMLVFDDADLESAAPQLEKALTVFAGQFCMTGSRLLVQSGAADKLRELMVKRLEQVKVGPASDPTSDMGPVIDRKNMERINTLVEEAIASGAKALVRGGPVREGPLSEGAFYRPTLLEVDDPSLPIFQDEIFGPVLTFTVFHSEREAVALANNSAYGLAASIWTRDVDRPLRVARELDAGTIWINDWAVVWDEFEEGGFKASGNGRLNGLSAINEFLEYKHIAFKSGVIPA